MTITPNQPKTEQTTTTLPSSEVEQQFNWKNCWYPVTFLQDLPKNRPYSFSLYDEPFVIFRNQEGKLACLMDLCPHRAAKLSDGQIIDGKIECLYHGWQFDTEGKCQHIPQLPDEVKIPNNACVQSFFVVKKQGIIWFWRGKNTEADQNLIPTIPDLDKSEFRGTDFMMDLPYDQSYLIENVIDPAHVHISHHGSLGNRKNAKPLEMEVIESSVKGIKSRYKYAETNNSNWINLDFFAPNLVVYGFTFNNKIRGGTALYSLPLGKGYCRLFLRGYSNFSNWITKLKPLWLSHWESGRILDEDSLFIMAEQNLFEHSNKTIKEIILPLKTSDILVIEYRKWLDKYGQTLPFYEGYTTSKLPQQNTINHQEQVSLNRFQQHTQICNSCNKAYQTTIRVKQIFVAFAIALAGFAIITDISRVQIGAVLLSILFVILAVVANQIQMKFERSYTRHS